MAQVASELNPSLLVAQGMREHPYRTGGQQGGHQKPISQTQASDLSQVRCKPPRERAGYAMPTYVCFAALRCVI